MIRGQKFEVNLDSDDEDDIRLLPKEQPRPAPFVADVLERNPTTPKAPSLPKLKHSTGFPTHTKRNVQSRFKQASAQSSSTSISLAEPHLNPGPRTGTEPQTSIDNAAPISWEAEERQRIDEENRARLASMSAEEIEEERRELMNSFSPAFLERLLKKSNIESGSTETNLHNAQPEVLKSAAGKSAPKNVSFDEPTITDADDEYAEELQQKTSQLNDVLPQDSVHFPRPPQPPSLDPASETFLEDLHQKYFPSLPSDPDKLEWMQSTSSKPTQNTYDPASTAFSAKDIRFDFKGELIPPKTAAEIPVTAGLHHHGDAPEAAGYTIAELAHLGRSTFAAQRCMAYQTLGRILYRLGKGEFGDPGEPDADHTGIEDSFGELARGLWWEVEKLQVIKILVDESEGRGIGGGKHVSAKAYATEAVWLWNKGGGRRWKAA